MISKPLIPVAMPQLSRLNCLLNTAPAVPTYSNGIITIISHINHNYTAGEPISVSSNIPNNALLNTHSHSYDISSILSLKMATLNCRGLRKTADSSTRNHFFRYIRTHSLDILALQETHASNTSIQDIFHN